eukprot:scaffold61788_cov63-Cyclotella_meneghiniana.AAC.1
MNIFVFGVKGKRSKELNSSISWFMVSFLNKLHGLSTSSSSQWLRSREIQFVEFSFRFDIPIQRDPETAPWSVVRVWSCLLIELHRHRLSPRGSLHDTRHHITAPHITRYIFLPYPSSSTFIVFSLQYSPSTPSLHHQQPQRRLLLATTYPPQSSRT